MWCDGCPTFTPVNTSSKRRDVAAKVILIWDYREIIYNKYISIKEKLNKFWFHSDIVIFDFLHSPHPYSDHEHDSPGCTYEEEWRSLKYCPGKTMPCFSTYTRAGGLCTLSNQSFSFFFPCHQSWMPCTYLHILSLLAICLFLFLTMSHSKIF